MLEKIQLMTLMFIGDLKAERDERGATAVEYGLMVALIAAFIIGSVQLLGQHVDAVFRQVADAIRDLPRSGPVSHASAAPAPMHSPSACHRAACERPWTATTSTTSLRRATMSDRLERLALVVRHLLEHASRRGRCHGGGVRADDGLHHGGHRRRCRGSSAAQPLRHVHDGRRKLPVTDRDRIGPRRNCSQASRQVGR